MSMPLENFVPQTLGTGDKFSPKDNINVPLLVKVHEIRENVRTKHNPAGTDGVIVDLLNLMTQEIKLGVIWFNPAIVDNMRNYVGKALPIELTYHNSGSGNAYIVPNMLSGQNLEAAKAWATQRPSLFEDERTRREIPQHMPSGMAAIPGGQPPAAAFPVPAQPPAVAQPPVPAQPQAPAQMPTQAPPPPAPTPVPVPVQAQAPTPVAPSAPPAPPAPVAPSAPPAFSPSGNGSATEDPWDVSSPVPASVPASSDPSSFDDEEPPF